MKWDFVKEKIYFEKNWKINENYLENSEKFNEF